MKSSLVLFMILLLSLTVIACSSSPDVQKESGSSIASNFTLSKVALEVSTIT